MCYNVEYYIPHQILWMASMPSNGWNLSCTKMEKMWQAVIVSEHSKEGMKSNKFDRRFLFIWRRTRKIVKLTYLFFAHLLISRHFPVKDHLPRIKQAEPSLFNTWNRLWKTAAWNTSLPSCVLKSEIETFCALGWTYWKCYLQYPGTNALPQSAWL